MATKPSPAQRLRRASTDPTPDAPAKVRKKPWEMTPSEIGDRLLKAMDDVESERDAAPKRFKRGEGAIDIEDDSALGDLPEE